MLIARAEPKRVVSLSLVERRDVLVAVDRGGLDAAALARLAPVWASLPTAQGGSDDGQPVKRQQELLRFYRGQLAALRA